MENYLEHHGVMGMHWGVRRYQPYSQGYSPKNKGKYTGEKKNAKKKKFSLNDYNDYFGTTNKEVGKGLVIGALATLVIDIGARSWTAGTDLEALPYYKTGIALVSGLLGGNYAAFHIERKQMKK